MLKEQYNYLINKEDWFVLKAEHLSDKTDRTLLWGCTIERESWHVYIKDEEIHTVIYAYNEDPEELEVTNNAGYIPNKRLYPECCDYQFCSLLNKYGEYMPFTTYTDDREFKQYYGKVLE